MGKEEAPHRTDQRPQTALLALSTSTAQLQSESHSQCQCRLTCLPPATHLPSPSPSLLAPFLAAFWSVRPLAFWKTKLFSHESNEMSRESLYHLSALYPPCLLPTLLPPLQQYFYCVQIVCGAPHVPPLPPQRVRQRHLGHIYQNILRIQKQKFATLPPALACQCGSCRRLVTTAPCPPVPLYHLTLLPFPGQSLAPHCASQLALFAFRICRRCCCSCCCCLHNAAAFAAGPRPTVHINFIQ